MRQVVKLIRKKDVLQEEVAALLLETDYLLIHLYHAMQEQEEKEQMKCKERLRDIQEEITRLRESLRHL